MAYPPSYQKDVPEDEVDEALFSPYQQQVMSNDLVHFDIDPSNSRRLTFRCLEQPQIHGIE